VTPTATVGALVGMQLILYFMYRRLAEGRRPSQWGVVYDEAHRAPVDAAVVRIFAMPYDKLLEAQVTDRAGRYNFRVGQSVYYVTAAKPGYLKTETDPFDLRERKDPTVIASDLPLRRVGGRHIRVPHPDAPVPAKPAPAKPPVPAAPAPVSPPP